MAESVIVELYEHEIMNGKIWISYVKKPWVNKAREEPSPPPDDIDTPGPEWSWECNWKIEKRPGFTDQDGWEYASKTKKFYGYPNRTQKSEGKQSDKARRRVWCRVMQREVATKQVDIHTVIPRIQQGLTGIHSARIQIEDIARQSPDQMKSVQMLQVTNGIHRNIQELLGGLETTERQCKEPDSGQGQYLAVLKKLKNDCIREKSALDAVIGPPVGYDSAASGSATDGRAGGSRRGSRRLSGASTMNGSNTTNNYTNSNNGGMSGSQGSEYGGSSNGSVAGTPDPPRLTAGVLSSSKQGNVRGSLSLTPVEPSNVSTQLLATSHNQTNNNPFDQDDEVSSDNGAVVGDIVESSPRRSGFGSKRATPTGVVQHDWDTNSNDGVFVDRHQHELMIEQKLRPVDEATVMAEIIEERAIEIEKMNKGIVEVNDMFIDLSRIVKEQQFEIDNIFNNAEESAAKTQEAYQQVLQANQYQKDGGCLVM
jgi:hypothetical protein